MKRFFSMILVCLALIAEAQTPQTINYQAVAHDAIGNHLVDQSIVVLITITDGQNGAEVFSETHSVTTNKFGLFQLGIGKGTQRNSSGFSTIDWSKASKWINNKEN